MRRFLFLLVTLCVTAVFCVAESTVDTLRINVSLLGNGDAVVSEEWNIDVDDNISEWYLVVGNLGKMNVSDLRVQDETGTEYLNEGEWDIDRSRERKAGRCGLVTKSDGYEICWGVGSSGPHTYRATYRLSGLVQGHPDLDGFNHMFVTPGLSSPPDFIELRIFSKDAAFSFDNSKIWAFGFRGDINFEEGEIVARTSEPFTGNSRMIVLAGFDKGIFNPAVTDDGVNFEQIRQKALEDSEYDSKGLSFWDMLAVILLAAVLFILPLVKIIGDRRKRRALLGGSEKDVAWFREAPVQENLRKAFNILTLVTPSSSDKANLISSYITRLLYRNALAIVPDADGKPRIKVQEMPEELVQSDVDLLSPEARDLDSERMLYGFFKGAAGEDGILQDKELRRWLKKNDSKVYSWTTALKDGSTLKTLSAEEVREVYGLKRFLKDFTLIEDRGAVEVGLWNNYLIFASLFGIADQLRKDFKKVCPEYFELSRTAASLNDPMSTVVWADINRMGRSINMASDRYYSRTTAKASSGGGGRASWGGGGGFSGGGFGGGGR